MGLKLVRIYFKIIGFFAPKYAANKAFELFQKVRKKEIRPREKILFEKASHFTIQSLDETIDCYELGKQNEEVVFLVHGIDSNAGSLSEIAFKLVENGKRVILFNLPGHAFSSANKTNIFICKQAFQMLIEKVKPEKPFSVYSHSFGSAVTAYTLAPSEYHINKLVMLSTPNRIEAIFQEFKRIVGLNGKVYQIMVDMAEDILGKKLAEIQVDKLVPQIHYESLLLVHDKNDKILDYENSLSVKNSALRAQLMTIENVGHYKMLWNPEVVEAIT